VVLVAVRQGTKTAEKTTAPRGSSGRKSIAVAKVQRADGC
jgi:hypothetical protein